MRDRFRVVTPENVEFDYELAGFYSRFIAWLLDVLIILAISIVIGIGVSTLAPVLGQFALALHSVLFFVVNWGYFVLLEWWLGGQSLGKKAVGLRVLSDDGVRISLMQSAVRNLFRVVDNLPLFYLVGGGVAFFSARSKRLGDMAAGTLVVRERNRPVPEAIVPQKERYNSFVTDRDVIKRVQNRLGLEEREVLISLALRREQLPLDQRLRLFENLALHLESRLKIERPEHFSAEKLCLNIAAVLVAEVEGVGTKRSRRRR